MGSRFRDTVFVVDDEKVNRAILSGLVRKLGFQCSEFASGQEAVAAFETARVSGSPVAAIIMDINMPGMDGLEAVWRIRAIEARQRQSCSCQDAVVPPSALASPSSPPQNDSVPRSYSGQSMVEADADCDRCKDLRVPVWAVSACSLEEQANSPAMKMILPSNKGLPWKLAGFDAFIPKSDPPVQLINMLSNRRHEGSQLLSQDLQVKHGSLRSSSDAASELTTVPSCKIGACPKLQANYAHPELAVGNVSPSDADTLPEVCTEAS